MASNKEEAKTADNSLKKLVSSNSTNSDDDTIIVTPRYEKEDRGQWSSKTEFMLSCIGYAVGIGNVCRFPYLCYRSGGGAFLVPYLLMLFICGIPLFMLEVVLGQFASTGAIGIFRMSPFFKGTGYAIVIVNFICVCYYSVIITYPIRFLTAIFTKQLPWETCNNSWNTEFCVNVEQLSHTNVSVNKLATPSEEFFHLKILEISDGIHELGGMVWPLFGCLFFSWVFLYGCIAKGIASVGKVVYFTATFPYFVLLVLFIRGVTLPGAGAGILFYITPEWNRLVDLKVWADAAIQIFFGLGPGWGGIVNMASYNNFRNNAGFDSIFIPIFNCFTSIFAGFVVFSVLGFLSHQTGLPVATVATSGPGLAFITYPQAIAMLPIPHLWAVLFFCMLFLLGLDSGFVQIEAIVASILDCWPNSRRYKFHLTLGACIVMFGISSIMVTRGGMYILQLLDWYSASIAVIMICLVETIMVAWIYGIKNLANDYEFMLGKKLNKFYYYSWAYVTPIFLVFMFFTTILFNRRVTYNSISYPDWAIALGWVSCSISIIWIPIYMCYVLIRSKKGLRRTLRLYLRAHDWAPGKEADRTDYEEFKRVKNMNKN